MAHKRSTPYKKNDTFITLAGNAWMVTKVEQGFLCMLRVSDGDDWIIPIQQAKGYCKRGLFTYLSSESQNLRSGISAEEKSNEREEQ